ncbi:TMV resistance protein N-like [Camellia sinensis]|uniref:TMV resistance protein N-like n=1 Tax=Camellia sinensis TaxID=4442 RepID=UPI0010359A51|nr:TMV resistance protein N-like [Camellia sinensis]
MDSSMEEMIKLLGLGMDDAHVVGIWGMGGIGKTTLASAIYAHISCQFEDYSFIENVREVSEKGGLQSLHEQLISEILMEKDLKVGNIGSALSTISNRVCRKKVHIVLDDVHESTELEKLVGELDWFGFGNNKLMMHDLIQELGWNVVRQESPKEPRQRSRYWLYEDSTHVLVKNMVRDHIEKYEHSKLNYLTKLILHSDIQLETLEVLNVSGCSKVENISVNFGYMKCLLELDLDGIGVSELPASIGHLCQSCFIESEQLQKIEKYFRQHLSVENS